MAQSTKTHEKQTAQGEAAAEDLSEAIEQVMEKAPDEEVRSIRVFGNCYRCNWWVRARSSHAMFSASSGTIRRSRFLRVSRADGKLVIEEVKGKSAGSERA